MGRRRIVAGVESDAVASGDVLEDRSPAMVVDKSLAATIVDSRWRSTRVPGKENTRRPWLIFHRGYRWSRSMVAS